MGIRTNVIVRASGEAFIRLLPLWRKADCEIAKNKDQLKLGGVHWNCAYKLEPVPGYHCLQLR